MLKIAFFETKIAYNFLQEHLKKEHETQDAWIIPRPLTGGLHYISGPADVHKLWSPAS